LPSIKNLEIVSPIVVSNSIETISPQQTELVLIHYGGLSSPIINFSQYEPFLVKFSETIIRISQNLKNIELIFTGNSRAMALLQNKFGRYENVSFQCLPFDMFQYYIMKAQCIITTPGIEAVYECFSIDKPVIFLPPTNSTQLGQVLIFAEHGMPLAFEENELKAFTKLYRNGQRYQEQTNELCKIVNTLAVVKIEIFEQRLLSFLSKIRLKGKYVNNILALQRNFIPVDLPNGLVAIENALYKIS